MIPFPCYCSSTQARDSAIIPQSPRPQHWNNASMGSSGAHLSAMASTYDAERRSWGSGQNRVALVLDGDDAAELFDHLFDRA